MDGLDIPNNQDSPPSLPSPVRDEGRSKNRSLFSVPDSMAKAEISSIFDSQKGENAKSRGQLLERKIEILESLAGTVSNRRLRRWLNGRLLIELVPRLNVEEIRGLFAPPPWGESAPLSAFCMTNVGEWDPFRNIDMDAEASILRALEISSTKRKDCVNNDKVVALNAWHRVDCRTREALRRNFLSDLVEGYEARIRAFIKDSRDANVLLLHVQDPFHRLLLHGVCEFYNLTSMTVTTSRDSKVSKMTRIKKKPCTSENPPNITLVCFLKMAKDGVL